MMLRWSAAASSDPQPEDGFPDWVVSSACENRIMTASLSFTQTSTWSLLMTPNHSSKNNTFQTFNSPRFPISWMTKCLAIAVWHEYWPCEAPDKQFWWKQESWGLFLVSWEAVVYIYIYICWTSLSDSFIFCRQLLTLYVVLLVGMPTLT